MPTFTNTGTGRTGSTQDWVVPTTGSYRIVARGAAGGYAWLLSTSTINWGGAGAIIAGDFDLVAGQTIRMMVGQLGANNGNASRGGGGGGGTFVINQTTGTLLIAAGGGGGAGQYAGGTNKDASVSANGNTGMDGGNTAPHNNGGIAPNGGGAGESGSYAGGGGGYSGNGTNASYGNGGASYTNGGAGGTGYNDGNDTTNFNGGYGGGGGSYAGAGGGGGYGGGGGGGWSYSGDGGGGGSYNTGANQSNTIGNAQTQSFAAHGSVDITPNNAPPTATLQSVTEGMEGVYPAQANWTHVDPDSDPQEKYQLRWRAVI